MQSYPKARKNQYWVLEYEYWIVQLYDLPNILLEYSNIWENSKINKFCLRKGEAEKSSHLSANINHLNTWSKRQWMKKLVLC